MNEKDQLAIAYIAFVKGYEDKINEERDAGEISFPPRLSRLAWTCWKDSRKKDLH